MPDVKWVDGFCDTPEEIPIEQLDGLTTCPIPVLPLAELEAWLEGERAMVYRFIQSQRTVGQVATLDALLAQVQAWRQDARPPTSGRRADADAWPALDALLAQVQAVKTDRDVLSHSRAALVVVVTELRDSLAAVTAERDRLNEAREKEDR